MKPPSPSFLHHPNGCSIEFKSLPDDFIAITSRRADRPDKAFGGPMDKRLARSYYKGWLSQGFAPETKGN